MTDWPTELEWVNGSRREIPEEDVIEIRGIYIGDKFPVYAVDRNAERISVNQSAAWFDKAVWYFLNGTQYYAWIVEINAGMPMAATPVIWGKDAVQHDARIGG